MQTEAAISQNDLKLLEDFSKSKPKKEDDKEEGKVSLADMIM